MSVMQTPTKSNISLPPLSSILLNNPLDTSINNTSDSFSLFSKNYDTSLNTVTSTPLLKKSKSFPSNHLPMPIQLPSLHYSLQNVNTINNSIGSINNNITTASKLPLLPLFKLNSEESTSTVLHSTPLRKSLPALNIKKFNTSTILPETSMNKITVNNNSSSPAEISNIASTISSTPKRKRNTIDESKSFAFISHSQKTFLSNEPDIDNARLARRKRRRTSPTELSILKDEFKKGMTPNKQRRISIAERVDMSEKAVQIWFQNKRQSLRKSQNMILDNSDSKKSISNESSNNDTDDDDNKENIIISQDSKISNVSTVAISRKPLADITNNTTTNNIIQTSPTSQTFKFKSTDFGLISHPTSSRKQKPIMKLKLKKELVSK